jgi:acetylornithine deacetylase/succinyl-diaminopimelate desuccinylase-like protein
MEEGCQQTMRLLREAGFQAVTRVAGKGQPAVFASLDAGASTSVGVYWMYDVKQVNPSEWSSPPWEARLVDRPGVGKVIMGRGAVNQKGPQASFLAAVRAIQAAGRKLPVNLVLIAEGEEEIGSPNFPQIVRRPEVLAALGRCKGIFMPSATQGQDGSVVMTFGAKGVIEAELTSTGQRSGRGPARDIHSSNKARVESPAWRLVHALATLTSDGGNTPAIEGFAAKARPLSAAEKEMIDTAARRLKEDVAKQQLGVKRWINDASWPRALEMLMGDPTVNIEGLVGGYTGPGGMTILPHKAVAKLDLRLVPDMTAGGALAALEAHLSNRGYGDIDVNMTGGYDPTSTSPDAPLVRAQLAAYKRFGVDPVLLPRNAGSWPGYVFTGDPLRLAAGHFGLGHGGGAHAPDEFYVIDSARPDVQGMDGAIRSFATYLYELAAVR